MSKGLEALEVNDRLVNQNNSCVQISNNEWKTIQKELKALEIIKKFKMIGKWCLYNDLTQEEFNLLKEVLEI